MASPHAVGVAALIISKYGHRGQRRDRPEPVPDAGVSPGVGDRYAVPDAESVQLRGQGSSAAYTAFCEGTPVYNGFYGHGIVDALAALNRNVLDVH